MELRDIELTLNIAGDEPPEWHARALHVRESVDDGYRVTVEVVSPTPFDLETPIGQDAFARVTSPQGLERFFHGFVWSVQERALHDDKFLGTFVVAAHVEVLKLGRDSRIFQEKSVVDVVTEVLDGAGVTDYVWETTETYEPHINIVQYRESDFDFISRLCAEEGIRFAVSNDPDGDHLRFFDDESALAEIDGETLLNDRSTNHLGVDTVADPRDIYQVASDQVAVRDYDYRQPSTDLTSTAEAEETTARESYTHPRSYDDPGRGDRLAQVDLERLQAQTHIVRAQTSAPMIEPGRTFSLSGSPRLDLNDEYQVLEVEHRLDDEDYESEVLLSPKVLPHRPQTPPPAPVLGGPQPAFVTVPGGEEIHTDEHGRSKVRFVWDRSGIKDDKSSTWLRVGQLALSGSMVLPRVDFEVLVEAELGDWDRPVIIGHLYNDELPPPYALPGDKTKSSIQTNTTGGSGGANELRFEDAGGGEQIFINASHDYTVNTANDASWTTAANETVDIGANSVVSITGNHGVNVGADRALDVGGNQSISVSGDYSDGIGGSKSVTIGGNRMVQVGGDHTEKVSGSLSRTVGSLQSVTGIAGYDRAIAGDSTTTVGALWGEIAGGSRAIDVKGSYTETVSALKMIKSKGVAVSCGAAYIVNAAAVKAKVGGSRTDGAKGAAALTAASKTKIDAANITISASSSITIRGGATTITLKSGGTAEVSAPTVIVKNAKALNQIMHKSN